MQDRAPLRRGSFIPTARWYVPKLVFRCGRLAQTLTGLKWFRDDLKQCRRPPVGLVALPQILAVDHFDRRSRGIEVIEQARIHADATRYAVPASVRPEGRAIDIGATATN